MTRAVVFFHAHPDDEVLLTGGTMARLAAEGHRVVLVTATAGEGGLAARELTSAHDLGELRRAELCRSAEILGCSRVVMLGYPDSGDRTSSDPTATAFSRTPPDAIARRLAQLLEEEGAVALTTYDAAGGYGHPDHLQVHRVGRRAAQLAGTRLVLDATVDRRALQRALRLVSWMKRASDDWRPSRFADAYTAHADITHCIDVSPYLVQKRAAMQAHASQTTADGTDRSIAWFLRLPKPLFRAVFGREWFVEHNRIPGQAPLDDILATLAFPT